MNKNKKIILLFSALILIVTFLIILFINHNKQTGSYDEENKMNSNDAEIGVTEDNALAIIGTWQYSDGTLYEFNSDSKGGMYINDYKYAFTYTVKGNELMIDYDNEEVHDAVYELSFEKDKMKLIGGEGTAGGEYRMTRAE